MDTNQLRPPPNCDSLEHAYAGSRHIQNYDGSSTYGARWHWAGAQNDHGAPLRAPSADTSSQQTYYTPAAGGAGQPERRSFLVTGTLTGDKRLLFAQGRPMAKDASGSGTNWAVGTTSAVQSLGQTAVESRFFFTGTVTATDMSRATDKREKDRIGVFGTSNSYAGSYGRVASACRVCSLSRRTAKQSRATRRNRQPASAGGVIAPRHQSPARKP